MVYILIGVLLVVAVVLVVLKKLGMLGPMGREKLPYAKKDYFFTKTEREFFDALTQATGNRWLIFAKVRVADLLYLPKGTADRQTHFNRIQSKHVDFVLCSREGVRPVLVIELNDRSHDEESRRDRDEFLDRAFADAGLPMLAYPAKSRYEPGDILSQINAALGPRPVAPVE